MVVLTIVFATFSLTRFLTDATEGLIGVESLSILVLLKAVIALEVLIPMGLYMALILTLGRMYSDSEVTALRASGISTAQVAWPALRIAFLLAALVGVVSWFIRPWAYSTMDSIEARAQASTDLDRIRAGQFYLYEERDRAVFVEDIDTKQDRLEGIFIRTRDAQRNNVEVVTSRQGRLHTFTSADRHELELRNANVYLRGDSGPVLYGEFGNFTMGLEVPAMEPLRYRAKSTPSEFLRATGDNEERAERQWRQSTPLITLTLALLALPLGASTPRRGRYGRLLFAVVVYAAYYNMIGIARSWVEQDIVNNLFWAVLLPLPLAFGLLWYGRRART